MVVGWYMMSAGIIFQQDTCRQARPTDPIPSQAKKPIEAAQEKLLEAFGFNLGQLQSDTRARLKTLPQRVVLGDLKAWGEKERAQLWKNIDRLFMVLGDHTKLNIKTLSPNALGYLVSTLSTRQVLSSLAHHRADDTHALLHKRLLNLPAQHALTL
jgi:hypothetical protein